MARAREILIGEADAVRAVVEQLDETFSQVVDRILELDGRVVTSGMGKAGFIARKISATLASTGTPAIFLHPAEALHGDLGRVMAGDLVMAFSKSGETEEVLRLIAPLKAAETPVVAVTQSPTSSLGRHSDFVLRIGEIAEVGPHGLAPSASTTAMLALGDAIALVVQEGRGFGPEEFARFHPGGDLGRQLMQVHELMRTGEQNPAVTSGASVLHALEVMTGTPGRPGATSVVDPSGTLLGFFTDGDLRRLCESGFDRMRDQPIDEVMTAKPMTIEPDMFALEALAFLHERRVDQMPVVGSDGKLLGLLDVQDLLDLKIG